MKRVIWLCLVFGVGPAFGQSWRTKTPTPRPTVRPTATPPATATPRPPAPTPTPWPTGTPVTIGDADGYAGITLAACPVAFPHRQFSPPNVQMFIRWSEAEVWRPIRQPWEGSAFVFTDGRPVTMSQGQVQIRWQDGGRSDTRWGGVVIAPIPNPTVTPPARFTVMAFR